MELSQQIEDQAVAQEQQGGQVDTQAIIDDMASKVKPEHKDLFEKMLISAGRIMFDKRSHQMMLDELNAEGPMEQRLSGGIMKLITIVWQKSNGTLPQELLLPAAVAFTLMAYQYLQDAGDQSANPAMLSEAIDLTLEGIAQQLGTTMDEIAAQAQGGQQAAPEQEVAPAQKPQAGGLLQEELA